MSRATRRAIGCVVVAGQIGLLALAAARAQAPAAPETSEAVFKNVQVLKGIPPDEFMDTMGMFASSLLYDCTGCHVPEILVEREAFAVSTPRIQKARQMVLMVNAINRTYFGGEPRVTCFSCHRGNNAPDVIPSLDLQYTVAPEDPNTITIFPDARIVPEAVFARYLEAIGGAARLAALTGFVARGTYAGFNTSEQEVPVEIYARAPDRYSQVVSTFEGLAVRTYDGRDAWAAEGWRQQPLMRFTGGNLDGARLEAIMAFPAGIPRAFARWQGSTTVIDDREVVVLQGSNPGALPVNLYFDESGLLVRMLRWSRTPVGTVPTRIDYSDYREVGGIRMPFRQLVTWTNGQNTVQLREVQVNVAIDEAKFGRPAPFAPR